MSHKLTLSKIKAILNQLRLKEDQELMSFLGVFDNLLSIKYNQDYNKYENFNKKIQLDDDEIKKFVSFLDNNEDYKNELIDYKVPNYDEYAFTTEEDLYRFLDFFPYSEALDTSIDN